MKVIKQCAVLASVAFFGISVNSWAITPDGTPGGDYSSPSPRPRTYSTPAPDSSPARPSARPSSGRGAPLLENPTADQVRKALGIGQPKTRDIAALKQLKFGSFIEFRSGSATVIPTNGLHKILEALLDLEEYASILNWRWHL